MTRLSNPARLLLVGDGLHAFGAWIDFLAILTLAVWRFQVTPLEMAFVGAAGLLPGILAGPALGRWCDRGDAKRLLLASMVLRVAATAALLWGEAFVPFLALVALRSVAASVGPPAIQVLALRQVAEAQRTRFYALLNLLNNSAKILAPALGTVSASLQGEALALALSAGCSALAALAFAFVPAASPPPGDAAHSAAPAPAAPAPPMLPVLWIGSAWAFSVFMANNLVPLVLQQSGQDKALLGILVSCSGAGNVLSGLWLARRPPGWTGADTETLRPAFALAAGFAAVAAVLAWGPVGLVLPLLFLCIGIVSARFAIALNVRLAQQHGAAIGAASARLQAWQNGMILLAPLLGALVLERAGGALLFATAAAALALALAPLALRLGIPPLPGRSPRP
jgi:MFS transporter, DHA1 family, staphyloferrin B biosynthesis exporter